MEHRRGEHHLPVLDEADGFARESLSPEPRGLQNPRKVVALVALVVLLVVTVIGTGSLVLRDLRLASASTTIVVRASVSLQVSSPTPDTSNPATNGWTAVAPGAGTFSDLKFAPSNGQLGYACGVDETQTKRIFATTTKGGDLWQVTPSLAGYNYCWIQISPTNPLDVVLNSSFGPCSGNCIGLDAHYSMDGGKTWKAAPIPQNTQAAQGGGVWAGQYLYIWTPTEPGTQTGLFKVSANGGAFTSIDPNALVPGARNTYLQSLVAGGSKLYANLVYDGCNATACTAVVVSGDGGKTWTQISHTLSLQVAYVAGTTLYGVIGGQSSTLMRSDDGGVTWATVTLPLLPSGQTPGVFAPDGFLPAPDGTLFAADGQSIDYLRGGNWTAILFSSGGYASINAVSADASGHPQRIWVLGSFGSDPHHMQTGIYWHAFP